MREFPRRVPCCRQMRVRRILLPQRGNHKGERNLLVPEPTIRDLELRCNEFDKDIDKFKFVVKFLGWVAAALGITFGSLFVYFQGKYQDLNTLEAKDEAKVGQLETRLSNLADLERRLSAYDIQMKSLEVRLSQAKNQTIQVTSGKIIQKAILDFESSPPTQSDAGVAYKSDLERLVILTDRYLGFLSIDPKEDSDHALNKELQNAAEAVRSRIHLTESTDTAYTWHVIDTPNNYKHLLNDLAAFQDQGDLTSARLACYKLAFPVWLDHVGLYGKPTKDNTDKCNGLLNLSK
jgi:hypothetical protein